MNPSSNKPDIRGRILRAAQASIVDGGLRNLKAREVALAADCSVGTVYNLFGDMDGLAMRVGSRTLARMETATLTALGKDGPGGPADLVVRMARAYLSFASANKALWRALFEHRLPDGAAAPSWLVEDQNRLFSHVEAPLAELLPHENAMQLAMTARSLFSAIHGVVSVGLDEKLANMSTTALDKQVARTARVLVTGLVAEHDRQGAGPAGAPCRA